MAATELAALSRTLGNTVGGFRQAANENNKGVTKVVKDIGNHFAAQKGALANMGVAMRAQNSDAQDVARALTQTNNFLRQSIGLQKEMLTAIKAMDKSVKAISSSANDNQIDPQTGMFSKLKALGIGGAVRAAAPFVAGGAAAVAGAGVLGYGANKLLDQRAIPGEDDGKSAYKMNIGEGDSKREVTLSEKDIERLAKIARAEAGSKTEGVAGRQAVIDTVLNRLASGQNKRWGADGGVRGVINHPKQFSPINSVGDVDKLPTNKELEQYKSEVRAYLKAKSEGRSQLPRDYTMFANPGASDPVNQAGWVGDMQRSGSARSFGRHVHGIEKSVSVPNYSLAPVGGNATADMSTAPASNQARPQGSGPANPQGVGRGRRGQNGRLPESMLETIEGGHRLQPAAAAAYKKMVQAARADGVNWSITDSYRTYEQQVKTAQQKGLYSEGGLAARPGTSNHGWGRALDLGGGANRPGSKQNKWLQENASRFGFSTIAREPWHWEFKGGGGGDAVPVANESGGGGVGPQAAAGGSGGESGGAAVGGGTAESGLMPIDQARAIAGVGMGRAAGGLGGALGGFGGGLGGLLGSAVNGLLGAASAPSAPQATMVQPEPQATAPETAQLNQAAVQNAAREATAQEAAARPTPAANVTPSNNQTNVQVSSVKDDDFTSGTNVGASWADKLLDSYYRNPQGIQTA